MDMGGERNGEPSSEATPLFVEGPLHRRSSTFVQPAFYGNAFGYSDSLRDLPIEGFSREARTRRAADRAIHVSIGANVLLLALKVFATVVTGSLAILASMVDSLLDLLSQVVIFWADRLSSQGIDAKFPAGRRRLEPIGVIICAALMGMAALEVLRQAVETIYAHTLGSAEGEPPTPNVSLAANAIVGAAIAIKAVLFVWCIGIAIEAKSHSVAAVAQDHFNDVLSNSVALAAAVLPSLHKGGDLWWIDPAGAVIISLYIIYSWVDTGREQVEMIVGKAAEPEFLESIRIMTENHHSTLLCDIIRAYHFGPKFLVEVEVVLPETTPLRRSHDIGMELQWKIEALDEVERAFVHIDYQTREYDEHDERSWKQFSDEFGDLKVPGDAGGGSRSGSPTKKGSAASPGFAVHGGDSPANCAGRRRGRTGAQNV